MKYIDEFLEYLTVIKKHSAYTIKNYRVDLLEFYQFNKKDILNIDKDIVNKYMQYLYDKKYSKTTISRRLSSLRSFYNYLYNNDIVSKNYFKDIHNPKKIKGLPHYLKEDEINKLFDIPDTNSSLGQRN